MDTSSIPDMEGFDNPRKTSMNTLAYPNEEEDFLRWFSFRQKPSKTTSGTIDYQVLGLKFLIVLFSTCRCQYGFCNKDVFIDEDEGRLKTDDCMKTTVLIFLYTVHTNT